MTSIIPPLRPIAAPPPSDPQDSGWVQGRNVPQWVSMGYEANLWLHPASGLIVISAVEVAVPEPGEKPLGPEYHLSISRAGERCTSKEAAWVLQQFGAEGATEDNHVPNGKVRNFWRPVADHLIGQTCPCQDEEPAMREDKGDYVWRGTKS